MKKTGRTPILFFSVVLAALACKLFVLDLMYVSGTSMVPALPAGSFVLEFKLSWGVPVPFANRYALRWGFPKPGDVVIFPWQDRWVIKRCAGVPGDPLAFERTENGAYMTLRGERVALREDQFERLKAADRVPEGVFLALGDNRGESLDSREYGFVSFDSVRGKVLWK